MTKDKLEALQSFVSLSDNITISGENDEAMFEAELDEETFEWVRDKLLEDIDIELRAGSEP
jgi:hypothetical protein